MDGVDSFDGDDLTGTGGTTLNSQKACDIDRPSSRESEIQFWVLYILVVASKVANDAVATKIKLLLCYLGVVIEMTRTNIILFIHREWK